MSKRSIEPLDPETWFERLEKLLDEARSGQGTSEGTLVRQACYLVKLAPGPFADLVPTGLGEAELEKMLDCGAYESAVMVLVGPKTTFTVRKDAGRKEVSATMSLEPELAPGHGSHPSCAKAMLQAWVRCLAITAGIELPGDVRNPGPRKFRSGWPPSSTEH